MCLGGIKGAAICIPAAPGCAAHRLGRRDAPASGTWARSASKVPRGGRVPPPALQSSGPAAEKGRSKGCHGCMGQLGRPPGNKSADNTGAQPSWRFKCPGAGQGPDEGGGLITPPPANLDCKHDQPASVRPHKLWVPALCDGARRGQHQRLDPRAERAGPGLTRARQGLCPLQVAGPHSGRPLATTSSRLSSTRST